MTTYEYTHHFDVDSTLVNEVFFNENDNSVVVSLGTDAGLYRYENVNRASVDSLVDAYSPGAYYNLNFKHAFGPGQKISWIDSLNKVEARVPSAGVFKDFTYADSYASSVVAPHLAVATDNSEHTKEYSLSLPVDTNDYETVQSAASTTKEYSLSEIDSPASQNAHFVRITIHFSIDGEGKNYKFKSNEQSVEDAVDELNDLAKTLGFKGVVKKAVVKFV